MSFFSFIFKLNVLKKKLNHFKWSLNCILAIRIVNSFCLKRKASMYKYNIKVESGFSIINILAITEFVFKWEVL